MMTGGAGFIGRWLAEELMAHDHQVMVFDIANNEREDVRSTLMVKTAIAGFRPDVIVHLAAYVGRTKCEYGAIDALQGNVFGTRVVAELCALYDIPMVYVSDAAVYGDHGEEIVDEDTIENINHLTGTYAISKLAGEMMASTYGPDDLKIARISMPYGPGVPPTPGGNALVGLVAQALGGQQMVVHRGSWRSWCWVGDIASGLRYVIEQGQPGIYNVGNDQAEVMVDRLASMILNRIGVDDEQDDVIRLVDATQRHALVKRVSCAKLRNLGWAPETELVVGLPKVIEWVEVWLLERGQSSIRQ